MQDFTIKKIKTKKRIAHKKRDTKIGLFFFRSLIVLFVVSILVSLVNGYTERKDNGLLWIHGKGNAKSISQSYFDEKELLSIVLEKKPQKTAKKEVTGREYYYELITKYFPEKPHIMIAIAKEESGLNPHAENYNCRYKISGKNKTSTTVYDSLTHLYIDLAVVSKERLSGYVSTWCRAGHQKYAWSKDSGLFGINSVHTTEILSPEEQVKIAREIYEKQGLNAWVSYKTNRYLKHMK